MQHINPDSQIERRFSGSGSEKDVEWLYGTSAAARAEIDKEETWCHCPCSSSTFYVPKCLILLHCYTGILMSLAIEFWLILLHQVRALSRHFRQWGGPFEPMELPGFLNLENQSQQSCASMRHNGTVKIQRSIHLHDNLRQIALTLDSSPIVVYTKSLLHDPDFTVDDIIARQWFRLSGSSVWLPEQRVFLLVTRVIFLGPLERITYPTGSFLRGQVYDKNWKELNEYTLVFKNKRVKFPLIFDVPTEYKTGHGLGPEDPRIILESVHGAEPVIVFNMIHPRTDWQRAIYVFRPFSGSTTLLKIRNQKQQGVEKNWSPFFMDEWGPIVSPKRPSKILHFVYSFQPLQILRCHLENGECQLVFKQSTPSNLVTQANEHGARLNGGTNFVRVPVPSRYRIRPDVQVWVAFARTHVHAEGHALYRPEFVVMIATGWEFHLAYASEALDFNTMLLDLSSTADPISVGRIRVPNSIADWDHEQDVMTVTWSVDDSTVQVARIRGLLSFVHELPGFRGLFADKDALDDEESVLASGMESWLGDTVRGCSVESAFNSALAAIKLHDELSKQLGVIPQNKDDRRQQQEQEEREEVEIMMDQDKVGKLMDKIPKEGGAADAGCSDGLRTRTR
jgi:hypothetical protein